MFNIRTYIFELSLRNQLALLNIHLEFNITIKPFSVNRSGKLEPVMDFLGRCILCSPHLSEFFITT